MYEYGSQVFSVGLEGLAQIDEDLINALAADGWEPVQMTPVHGGFAALVLFRREGGRPRRSTKKAAVRKAPAKKAPVRKAAAKKTVAKKAVAKKAVGAGAARRRRA